MKGLLALTALAVLLAVLPAWGSGDDSQQENMVLLPGGLRLLQQVLPAELQTGSLLVIAFEKPVDSSRRQALLEAGLHLRQMINGTTWWVTVTRAEALTTAPTVAGIIVPGPLDKLFGRLQAARLRAGIAGGSSLPVTISYLPGSSVSSLRERLEKLGAEHVRQLSGDRFTADVSPDKLLNVASDPEIVAVASADRPRILHNKRSGKLSNADTARKEYSVSGMGVIVGVWDGGAVFNHNEFGDRVVVMQSRRGDDHATHVAGTIGASGNRKKATGFAPEVTLESWYFEGDTAAEVISARAATGLLLSNNSWGLANGWEWEGEWVWYGDEFFGTYSADARAYDLAVERSGAIIVFSAGNDRSDKGAGNGRYFDFFAGRYQRNMPHPADGPYGTIGEVATAKNAITVGALKDRGSMTNFSSWGPTRDGRIKPEITANGHKLYSTVQRNRFAKFTGTSMAAPSVTGGLALAAEAYSDRYNEDLPPDVAKALLVATAEDLGTPGPDYQYGFGLMDVEAMVGLLRDMPEGSMIVEGSVSENGTLTYSIAVPDGARHLRVALCWIDPAAAPFAEVTLVNDLDLKLTGAGQSYLPWMLDGSYPSLPATRGVNNRDTVELIEINNPTAGTWTARVQAPAINKGSSQRFALVMYVK